MPELEDRPGLYTIESNIILRKGIQLDSSDVQDLDAGYIVDVVELAEADMQLRGRIANPDGWMSIKNLEDNFRWATPMGEQGDSLANELQEDEEDVDAQLCEVLEKRQAVDTRLQDLRAQLGSLQLQVQSAERERQLLSTKESRLRQRVGLTDDQDWFGGSGGASPRETQPASCRSSVEPMMFEFEMDDGEGDGTSFDFNCAPDADDDDDMDDWEHGFDALGIAKCRLCGLKLPLDIDAIDRHSKECEKKTATDAEYAKQGHCRRCDEFIPLDVHAIELHSRTCSGGGRADKEAPLAASANASKAQRSSKRRGLKSLVSAIRAGGSKRASRRSADLPVHQQALDVAEVAEPPRPLSTQEARE